MNDLLARAELCIRLPIADTFRTKINVFVVSYGTCPSLIYECKSVAVPGGQLGSVLPRRAFVSPTCAADAGGCSFICEGRGEIAGKARVRVSARVCVRVCSRVFVFVCVW